MFDDPVARWRTVRWTYADLLRQSPPSRSRCSASGLGKGGRVGILMGNRPEAVASLFGAALAGAVAVPLSTFSPEPELSHLIAHADLSVLLAQTTMGACAASRGDAAALSVGRGGSRRSASTGSSPARRQRRGPRAARATRAHLRRGIASSALGQAVVTDEVLDAVAAQVHPSDLALIIYSSGTTDRPKGVLHYHEAIARQFWTQARLFGRDAVRRGVWCPLPLVLDGRDQRRHGCHARRRRARG